VRWRIVPDLAREVALSVAVLVFAAAVAVPAASARRSHPTPPDQAGTVATTAIPWLATSPTYRPDLFAAEVLPPDRVATAIKSGVFMADPLLLPMAIPPGSEAYVGVNPISFQVDYLSRPTAQRVVVKIGVLPPPLGPHATVSTKTFRNVSAPYSVDDPADPRSYRYVAWNEPGSFKGQSTAGVPYFLSATGFTDAEFWRLAGSMAAAQWPDGPRSCRAADLDIRYGASNGATGHLIHVLLLGNRSATPCSVQGTPRLTLTLRDGTVVANSQIDANPMGPVAAGPVVLRPGLPAPMPYQSVVGQGWLSFEWTYCPKPTPAIGGIVLDLPKGGGTVSVSGLPSAGVSSSRCDVPGPEDSLLVGPFKPAASNDPVPRPPPQLSIAIKAPATAFRGEALRYEVALTNITGVPFHFDACPAYREAIDWPHKEWAADYQLNCASVGTLAPGASATFAMLLNVPDSAPTGTHTLTWAFFLSSELFVPAPVVGSADADGHGTARITISSR